MSAKWWVTAALVMAALGVVAVSWRGGTSSPAKEAEHGSPAPGGTPSEVRAGIYGERPGQALLGVRGGVEIHFYWPADPIARHLSGEEAEFILVNTNTSGVTLHDPAVTFVSGSQPIGIYSGTWEKFPSRTSWEKIEYINIGKGQYRGALSLGPGERGKLHYHLLGSPTAVRLQTRLTVGGSEVAVNESVQRPADRGPISAPAAH